MTTDDEEQLIIEIIMLVDSKIKDGLIPRAGGGEYASPKAVALWKHTTPAQIAWMTADDAIRLTFRILRERGLLT